MKYTTTSIAAIATAVILAASSGSAMAANAGGGQAPPSVLTTLLNLLLGNSPLAPGQPNQSCEDNPNQPGNSISAPGSAFNPDGTAGKVYAGEQPQNSQNPKSVSQYDVACTRPTH